MTGSYSLLGQMRDRPYAIGERGGNSTVPLMPLLSGQSAVDSLVGYYPSKRMDSSLNPHTNPMRSGPRATNKPNTKTAGLNALAARVERKSLVKLATAIGRDPGLFRSEHPLVAGFLIKCGEAGLSDTQILERISQACSESLVVKLAFEKIGGLMPETVKSHPLPNAVVNPSSLDGPPVAPGKLPIPKTVNQTPDLPGSTLGVLGNAVAHPLTPSYSSKDYLHYARRNFDRSYNPASSPKEDTLDGVLRNTSRVAGGVGAAAGAGAAAITSPAWAPPVAGAAMGTGRVAGGAALGVGGAVAGKALNAVKPAAKFVGNTAAATGVMHDGMKMVENNSQGSPLMDGTLVKGVGNKLMGGSPAGAAEATPGLDALATESAGTPTAAGAPPTSAEGAPAPGAPVAGAPGDPAAADEPFGMKQISELIASSPEKAKQFFDQATEQVKGAGQQIKGAVQQAQQTGDVPPELAQQGQAALSAEGFSGERAMQAWDKMDLGQKLLLGGGLSLTAVGLVSAMTGQGGIMPWLMTLLGLGTAAFTAGKGGMLDQGSRDAATGISQAVTGSGTPEIGPTQQKALGMLLNSPVGTPEILAKAMGPLSKMYPEISTKLDQAAGTGSWGNAAMSWLGDVSGQTNAGFEKFGITPEQVPKVLEAWRLYRQGQQPAG
jgi:hypothetical protein